MEVPSQKWWLFHCYIFDYGRVSPKILWKECEITLNSIESHEMIWLKFRKKNPNIFPWFFNDGEQLPIQHHSTSVFSQPFPRLRGGPFGPTPINHSAPKRSSMAAPKSALGSEGLLALARFTWEQWQWPENPGGSLPSMAISGTHLPFFFRPYVLGPCFWAMGSYRCNKWYKNGHQSTVLMASWRVNKHGYHWSVDWWMIFPVISLHEKVISQPSLIVRG